MEDQKNYSHGNIVKNCCPGETGFQSFFDEARKNLPEDGEILELALSPK